MLAVLLLIVFLTRDKTKSWNTLFWIRFSLTFVIAIIFDFLLSFVPFENIFMSFPTAESSFEYSYSESEIKEKVESKDCTYFYYDDGSWTYINKNSNGTYRITADNSIFFNIKLYDMIKIKNKERVFYNASSIYNPYCDETLVSITETNVLLNRNNSTVISDSENNRFAFFSEENHNTDSRIFYKIIEGEIPDNYYIYINDEKVEIM